MNASYAETVSVSNAQNPAVPADYAPDAGSVQRAATAHAKTAMIPVTPAVPAKNVRTVMNVSYAATANVMTAMTRDLLTVRADNAPDVMNAQYAASVYVVRIPDAMAHYAKIVTNA